MKEYKDVKEKKKGDSVLDPRVLLAIACVILVTSVLGLILLFSLMQSDLHAPTQPSEPALPGGEILAGFVISLAYVFLMMLAVLVCTFLWGACMLICARLAFDRQGTPHRLWVFSVVLTAVFAALSVAGLSFVVYMARVLFV